MCTQFRNDTVGTWLDKQIAVLDCWIESETLNTTGDMRLVETLQRHSDWLKQERDIIATLPSNCLRLEVAE